MTESAHVIRERMNERYIAELEAELIRAKELSSKYDKKLFKLEDHYVYASNKNGTWTVGRYEADGT